ncbi:ROK family protein [Nonomuraea ferruginea]
MADGRVYRGARGGAGEFGHLCVDPRGPACGCGARGCLEAFVGSAGLLAAARARSGDAPVPDGVADPLGGRRRAGPGGRGR